MEAADGSTGYCYEQAWEDRIGRRERLRAKPCGIAVVVAGAKVAPQFRNVRQFHKQAYEQGKRHEEQGERKQRIYLADNLVDWQHRGYYVVGEDDYYPHHLGTAQCFQYDGRTVNKHHSYHDEEQDGEDKHNLACESAKVTADKLGQPYSAMTDRQHTAEIVVHGSGKNAAEDNPQIGHRTIPRSHDGTKDRTSAGNVQELYHKDFPTGHDDVIHTISLGYSRSGPVVGPHDMLNKFTVEQVAYDQRQKGNSKRYHFACI